MLRHALDKANEQDLAAFKARVDAAGKDTGKKSSNSLTAVAKTARDAKILAQSSTLTANVASEFCKTNKDDLDEHRNVIKELKRKLAEFEGMITHDVSVLWAYLKKVMDHADSGWRTKVGYKEPTGPAPPLRVNVQPKWDWLVQMTPPALEAHHPPASTIRPKSQPNSPTVRAPEKGPRPQSAPTSPVRSMQPELDLQSMDISPMLPLQPDAGVQAEAGPRGRGRLKDYGKATRFSERLRSKTPPASPSAPSSSQPKVDASPEPAGSELTLGAFMMSCSNWPASDSEDDIPGSARSGDARTDAEQEERAKIVLPGVDVRPTCQAQPRLVVLGAEVSDLQQRLASKQRDMEWETRATLELAERQRELKAQEAKLRAAFLTENLNPPLPSSTGQRTNGPWRWCPQWKTSLFPSIRSSPLHDHVSM